MRFLTRGAAVVFLAAVLTVAIGCGDSSSTKGNNSNPNAKPAPSDLKIDPATTGSPGAPGAPKPAAAAPAGKPAQQ